MTRRALLSFIYLFIFFYHGLYNKQNAYVSDPERGTYVKPGACARGEAVESRGPARAKKFSDEVVRSSSREVHRRSGAGVRRDRGSELKRAYKPVKKSKHTRTRWPRNEGAVCGGFCECRGRLTLSLFECTRVYRLHEYLRGSSGEMPALLPCQRTATTFALRARSRAATRSNVRAVQIKHE
jgi:hypothetical protein